MVRNFFRQFATAKTKLTSSRQGEVHVTLQKTSREIAERIIGTQLLLTRWSIEAAFFNTPDQVDQLKVSFDVLDKCLQSPFLHKNKAFFTTNESLLLKKKFGTWDSKLQIAAIHPLWESFGVLLWALKIFRDIGSFEKRYDSASLYGSTAIIPAFPETVQKFHEYFSTGVGINKDHTISSLELKSAINRADAWVWRSQAQTILEMKNKISENTELHESSKFKTKATIEGIDTIINETSQKLFEANIVEELSEDGDFLVGKTAYHKLKPEEIRNLNMISSSRSSALKYLIGKQDWDELINI